MITSREELIEYLEADRMALGRNGVCMPWDRVWKYEKALRKCEYYYNTNRKIRHLFARYIKYKLECKTGLEIPLNSFGKGLSIAHAGPIIVHGAVRVGEHCRIHVGVNIGTAAGKHDDCPTIGNNVYIGPGAKIFGKISIADDIAIGANAVVNKSFEEPCVAIAGIPAKVINHDGSKGLL